MKRLLRSLLFYAAVRLIGLLLLPVCLVWWLADHLLKWLE